MEKLLILLNEYLNKAISGTEKILEVELDEISNLNHFLDNRDRLLQLISKIANEILWENVEFEKRNTINQQIEYIKKLDERFIQKLQQYRIKLQSEIEKTFRQKENIKGYNLNNTR